MNHLEVSPCATKLPSELNSDAQLKLPQLLIDFYPAQLLSVHATVDDACQAAAISAEVAIRVADAITQATPLVDMHQADGTTVCIARLPGGQFGQLRGQRLAARARWPAHQALQQLTTGLP